MVEMEKRFVQRPAKSEYPCLKQHTAGHIVFFYAPGQGVDLSNGNTGPWTESSGDYRSQWTLFPGDVVVRNT